MCAVSAVGDDWTRKLPGIIPHAPYEPWTDRLPAKPFQYQPPVSREEFDRLKEMVEQMHKELQAARKQDIENGEPDCEMEDKVVLLKSIAKAFGVDLSDVFPEEA